MQASGESLLALPQLLNGITRDFCICVQWYDNQIFWKDDNWQDEVLTCTNCLKKKKTCGIAHVYFNLKLWTSLKCQTTQTTVILE